VPRRRRIETWGGFALGLLAAPLFMLAVARSVGALGQGLDATGDYGVAIAGARDLAAALDRYRARHQRIPDAKDGLVALVPEFVEHVPDDPWGHAYVYEPTGPDWADVLSYGADGRAGGRGAGADISARFGRLGSRPPGFVRPLTTLLLAGLPLAAALAASRRRWCASALAGMGAFWAVILLATVSPTLRSIVPWLSLTASLACLVGAIALLRGLRYAALVSLLSIVVAHLLLQYVVTS
jgi:general secretion pathway protein G